MQDMVVSKDFLVSDSNFYPEKYEKKQIVFGNSFTNDLSFLNGWKTRVGGNYKKTAMFTIDIDGKILQHFDSDYYSDFLPNTLFNKHIISILLVNSGWFDYDLGSKKYIDYCGNIYNGTDVVEQRWRNHTFWQDYTSSQLKSASELVNMCIEKHNIPKLVIGHNTYIKDIESFKGISYRSNWIKDSTDLNPSWKFKEFKQLIEMNNEIINAE